MQEGQEGQSAPWHAGMTPAAAIEHVRKTAEEFAAIVGIKGEQKTALLNGTISDARQYLGEGETPDELVREFDTLVNALEDEYSVSAAFAPDAQWSDGLDGIAG